MPPAPELPLERSESPLLMPSERPVFLPNSTEEPLFCCPMLEEVLRFTSPPDVDPVFLLTLSRSRFSMRCLLRVISSAMAMPLGEVNRCHTERYRKAKTTETV